MGSKDTFQRAAAAAEAAEKELEQSEEGEPAETSEKSEEGEPVFKKTAQGAWQTLLYNTILELPECITTGDNDAHLGRSSSGKLIASHCGCR